jgi:hypothetical protein
LCLKTSSVKTYSYLSSVMLFRAGENLGSVKSQVFLADDPAIINRTFHVTKNVTKAMERMEGNDFYFVSLSLSIVLV